MINLKTKSVIFIVLTYQSLSSFIIHYLLLQCYMFFFTRSWCLTCLFPPFPNPPPWRIFSTSFIQHCKDPCLLARSKGIIELTSFCLVSSYYRAIHTHKNNNNNICIQFFKHQKRKEDDRKLWKLCLSLFFVLFC